LRSFKLLEGTVPLWAFLNNKFHWDYYFQEYLLTACAGLACGIIFLILSRIIFLIINKNKNISLYSVRAYILIILGLIFSATPLLAGQSSLTVCDKGDVIKNNEDVGNYLAKYIPPGSTIYWETEETPIPLLYIEGIKIYPPQLNNLFYFQNGGDPDLLYREGYWNEELAKKWLSEADFLVLGENAARKWEPILSTVLHLEFDQLEPTNELSSCRSRTFLRIYRRADKKSFTITT